jgi:hypothetical protein
MAITRDQLVARLKLIESDIELAKAHMVAFDGARQEVEYWLSQLDAESTPPEPQPE